jgi:hypothetical protein
MLIPWSARQTGKPVIDIEKYDILPLFVFATRFLSRQSTCTILRCRGRVKLCHKDVWRNGCIDPRFLAIGNQCGWSCSRPCRFNPQGKSLPVTHLIGDLVNPRAGLDALEKWEFFTLPELDHPAHSQSRYRPNHVLYRTEWIELQAPPPPPPKLAEHISG